MVRVFLSWRHQDCRYKDALLADLVPALGLFTDLAVEWWEDSHLLCGEDLPSGIVTRIDEADYGLLLLSNRYFASPFILAHELPRFVGPTADRTAIPVALTPLPAHGPELDLHGVERRLIFTEDGRSFAEQRGTARTRFANQLAAAIRRRALDLDGYRTL